MRGSGRTTRMLRRALELAREHHRVIVMVPGRSFFKPLTQALHFILCDSQPPYDKLPGLHPRLMEEERELVNRIQFCSTAWDYQALTLGQPPAPTLADHTWLERTRWIDRAKEQIKKTESLL